MSNEWQAGFARSLAIQLRVIGALLMREIITRYGRHNLGFLWLLLEPIIFTVGVVILWSTFHNTLGFRVEVVPFIVTGYSSLLLWRICSFRGIKAIEPNRSLLHHRQVKIQDIFIARMLLDVAGVTASFFLLMVTMMGLELLHFPEDLLLLVAGWLLMSWFSACLGTILGCLSEHTELVERLWHPGSYFMLAVSGTFFMVDWVPADFQDLVLWVPMVHPIEMMRAGYWGDAVRTHYSIGYIVVVCMLMSLVALLLMADRRMKTLT
jgi:capsular polysaccharide transport system permease protein